MDRWPTSRRPATATDAAGAAQGLHRRSARCRRCPADGRRRRPADRRRARPVRARRDAPARHRGRPRRARRGPRRAGTGGGAQCRGDARRCQPTRSHDVRGRPRPGAADGVGDPGHVSSRSPSRASAAPTTPSASPTPATTPCWWGRRWSRRSTRQRRSPSCSRPDHPPARRSVRPWRRDDREEAMRRAAAVALVSGAAGSGFRVGSGGRRRRPASTAGRAARPRGCVRSTERRLGIPATGRVCRRQRRPARTRRSTSPDPRLRRTRRAARRGVRDDRRSCGAPEVPHGSISSRRGRRMSASATSCVTWRRRELITASVTLRRSTTPPAT